MPGTLHYSSLSPEQLRRKLSFWRYWAAIATVVAIMSSAAYLVAVWPTYRAELRTYPILRK